MTNPLRLGAPTASFEPPDLTGFLGGHDIMRTQFALIARAAGEVSPSDSQRIEALDDHLGYMMRRLVWHHTHEDERIFPTLGALDAGLADLLGDLEQDHASIDDRLALAGDAAVALPARAGALRDLHRELSTHLEREEASAVPAIRRLIPRSAWALEDQRFQDELGAERDATLVWILGHLPPPARAGLLAQLPPPVQELYETVWRPTHERQLELMYGRVL